MIKKSHFRRSLVQFRTNPLRTALALLGMVLGVSSVVGMVSIGEGAQREIIASIEALGGDVVHIKAKDIPEERIAEIVNDSRGLNRNDILALQATVPGLGESTYARWTNLGVSDIPASTYNMKIVAAEPKLFQIHRLKVAEGRALLELDQQYQRKVVVLGSDSWRISSLR